MCPFMIVQIISNPFDLIDDIECLNVGKSSQFNSGPKEAVKRRELTFVLNFIQHHLTDFIIFKDINEKVG